MSTTIKALGNVGKKLFNSAHYILNMAFTFPTAVRKAHSAMGDEDEGINCFFLPALGAVILDGIYYACKPSSLSHEQSLAYNLLPVATHALSGLYEFFRYERNKIISSNNKHQKPKNLENKTE